MRRGLLATCFGAVVLSGCQAARAVSGDEVGTGGAAVVCDGSSGVRLAIAEGGGGQVAPGTMMLSENGWRFLLVEGTCATWILSAAREPVRTLTLSSDQEQRLSKVLRLSHLGELAGSHLGGCADAPGLTARFDEQRVTGTPCGSPPGEPFSDFSIAVDAQIDELYSMASEISGDMRYLVLQDPQGAMSALGNRIRTPWPLDVPVESIALTPEQAFQYVPGGSRRATGMEAARLRAIRTTAANGSTVNGLVFDYTVVTGADGTPYLLYARDSVPFEDDRGLLPAGTF